MVVMSAIFVMFLVVSLTVTINLGEAVQNKIKAQNAVDAAALTGVIWQVRGNHFIQDLNNMVYYSDTAAFATLGMAAVCSACTGIPVVGQALNVAGAISLGLSVVCHFTSHCILIPFRDVAQCLFPVVCYVAAGEMAGANGASSVGGVGVYLDRLSREILQRVAENASDAVPGTGFDRVGMSSLSDFTGEANPFLRPDEGVLAGLADLPLHTVGIEATLRPEKDISAMLQKLPMTLHLQKRYCNGLAEAVIGTAGSAVDAGVGAVVNPVKNSLDTAPDPAEFLVGVDSISFLSPGAATPTHADSAFAGNVEYYVRETWRAEKDELTGEITEDVTEEATAVGDKMKKEIRVKTEELVDKLTEKAGKEFLGALDMVPPLKIGDVVVKSLLKVCVALPVSYPIARGYYTQVAPRVSGVLGMVESALSGKEPESDSTDGPIWNHPYYETVDGKGKAIQTSMHLLPITTWMVMLRDEAGQRQRTAIWERMGGLGVPTGGTPAYGELGVMALASAQACIQPVVMLRPAGLSGSVQLTPVKLFDEEPNMLDYGICH